MNVDSIVLVAHIRHETEILNVNYNTTTPGINANPGLTEGDFIGDFRQPCVPQRQKYTGQLSILVNHISSEADTTAVPEYDNIDTMTATLQHLHMRMPLTQTVRTTWTCHE